MSNQPIIKSTEEIAYMRQSCRILAKILNEVKTIVKEGISTKEIDLYAEELMNEYKVTPSFKGYRGYPAVTCTPVNEEIVHAIPGNRKLKPGDIISIDSGVIYEGFHSDCTIVLGIEPLSPEVKKFMRIAEKALENGIQMAKPGNRTGDISAIIQKTIEKAGYSVVREFTGHGIGRNLHEQPPIANLGRKGSGNALIPGMTIAIEPIFNMGGQQIKILDDKWTAVTKDGSLAIQIEHTVLITPTGAEVLTKE